LSLPPPDQPKDVLQRVLERWNMSYDGVHKRCRDRWENLYALYAQYTDWRNTLGTDRRDRDQGLREAQREWGAELFIPYAFSTVETILPRMLSNSPRVIIKPKREAWEDNADAMKTVVESQFANIDYELRLQRIARTGLKLGLGVQKTYWASKKRKGKQLAPATTNSDKWVVEPVEHTLIDDPFVEWVDPFDFVWDPFAANVQECEWVIHRTWRSTDYVTRLVEQKVWKGVEVEDVRHGSGGSSNYTEVRQNRMRADGYPDFRAPDVHEVWEYHDGDRIVTVLDRQWVVQDAPNPAWHGEIPFQVYRPTPRDGRLDGIGEIEPIVDLQYEINTLRSQRRDNATIVLQRAYAYQDGMIDPADFKIGPGRAIPTLGDPREVIFPLPTGDIPASGYQEEARLQADIERTTGIDDSLSGAGNSQQTATGVQLVQAAANERIRMKTRTAEVELVRAAGRQFMALNQQKILSNREVRVPSSPTPGEPDRRWAWRRIGPQDLRGEFELEVEGGSMAPENVPQQRQDAQFLLGLLQSPVGQQLDQRLVVEQVLGNAGIKEPARMIVEPPKEPTVPQAQIDRALGLLAESGVDRDLIQQAISASRQPPEEGENGPG
jgi:hypothetical protein